MRIARAGAMRASRREVEREDSGSIRWQRALPREAAAAGGSGARPSPDVLSRADASGALVLVEF